MHGKGSLQCHGAGRRTCGALVYFTHSRRLIHFAVSNFNWTSGNYIQKIATLFPNVKALRVSPFHGMTDIILQSRSLGLVPISEPSVCCVEVGVIKTGTCSFSLGGTMKMWPLKFGELLASMHLYGTLNYANTLGDFTQPHFTIYGILIVRAIGCIMVKMLVNEDGCNVSVLHEGGCLSIGPSLQYLANRLSA